MMREGFGLLPITEDAVLLKMQQLYTVEKFGWFLDGEELSLEHALSNIRRRYSSNTIDIEHRGESAKERTAAMMAHGVVS
jgi:hypothetical protein